MKYFIDTEFIEGFKKPLFGKKRHFIDLISIGIVAEDGREFYAVSKEFNPRDADKWVTDNVLTPLELEFYKNESAYAKTYHSESLILKNFLKWRGKSNKQIANAILTFIHPETFKKFKGSEQEFYSRAKEYGWGEKIEFYGYYADYDWVLFCSLFGRMVDLPKDFPMHCIDLKQSFDDAFPIYQKDIKECIDYPKQTNEHNALADAKWNKELYHFITSV